ncbi:MAG TPA: endonuclease/exonuclease/phosphatase family protein [Lacibacter sp.]|nr:endonuclease/exonuclease/phosphatase family protein [Lacibacter sp.]HMO88518.1 endonuclease/exonuclease/phosphatase family protein [Lacibacter sp.]HMP87805.1 endonuclease/exonuclease/phosphatase family protein [Lacibacter sp.]
MAGILRSVTKQFFIAINAGISACMLLLYLLPHSNQDYFWILNLFALAFPFLLALQVLFLLFWLLAKPRLSLLPLLTLALCYSLIRPVIGLHAPDRQAEARPGSLRVASWNVHLFDFYENRGQLDPAMLQKARQLSADILCVQELVYSLDTTSPLSLERVKKRLGYAHAVTGNDRSFGVHTNIKTRNEVYYPFCLGIFSKYPIVQWKKVQSLPEYNHTFIWADIAVDTDTLRVFNIHLQSMHFVKNDYEFIENIDQKDVDQVKLQGRNILRKMKSANLLRAQQVNDVRRELEQSPYPVLLCGDFNDVPNSYSYQVMKRQLNDVFPQRGWGLGRTFNFLSPTLRLDFIFHSPGLRPLQYKVPDWQLSDHRPVTAVFEWPAP